MSFNNNNRLNMGHHMYQAPQPSDPIPITPRTFTKFFLSNVKHLPENIDYQTYFNIHGLCGRRSVSPVHFQHPAAFAANHNPYAFQHYPANLLQPQPAQATHFSFNNTPAAPSSQHHNNNYTPTIHYGISNTYSLVEPSTPNALKIPTTPTRSKSLSPSLRTVLQPPRIRHKQNAMNANISHAASTMSVSSNKSSSSKTEERNQLPVITKEPYHQPQQQHQIQKPIAIHATKQPLQQQPIRPAKESNNENKASSKPVEEVRRKPEEKKAPKSINFQLPFNVRTVNLSNFPQASNGSSKKSTNKLKGSSNPMSAEKSLTLLRKSLQMSVNEKIKELLDDYKRDFIEPAIENLRRNLGHNAGVTQEDSHAVCAQLLDEAKLMFLPNETTEAASASESSDVKYPSKRKSLYDAFLEREAAAASCLDTAADEEKYTPASKKQARVNENDDSDETSSNSSRSVNINTKFVLGKSANRLYLLNSGESNSDSNNKSIYTNYPTLFRYESDQADKKWLFNNAVIQKRMVKCYIFLYDDLLELFAPPTDTKQLKPFKLPQFIVDKVKKQLNRRFHAF